MGKNFNVCILGGGPAGLTAAIYSGRYGLKTALISREIGGTANLAHKIENYPGYRGSGERLMKRFHKQAEKSGTEFLNENIIDIERRKNEFIVTTTKMKFSAKAVIIALGLERRKLNIPGEDKFLGRGVSYCATCDAPLFRNKNVAVIGGGDSACKAALLLSEYANKVYVIYRNEKEGCENILSKELSKKKNIEFLYNTTPFEIRGREVVSDLIVVIDHEKIPKEKKLMVDGVFIEIGGLPVSDIAKLLGVKVDKLGHVLVDEEMKTNIKGVFAAGDIVKSKLKQIIVAASQGAIAAKSCQEYLENQ